MSVHLFLLERAPGNEKPRKENPSEVRSRVHIRFNRVLHRLVTAEEDVKIFF